MRRRIKMPYDSLMDQKVSYDIYCDAFGSDNSKNLNTITKLMTKVIEEQLTEKQRRAIEWYYSRNINIPEIAKILGVNKSTVSRQIKGAKIKLKNYMQYTNFRQ